MESEEFALDYLIKKFQLEINDVEKFDGSAQAGVKSKFTSLELLKSTQSDYWTPDFVVSSNNNDSLEDICFIDVSAPQGSLLTKVNILIDQELALARKKGTGQVTTVELSKQVKPLVTGVRSKLNKINIKYAKNRDRNNLKSINTGLIFCLDSEDRKKHSNNLDAHQLSITILELCHLLSSGRCQFNDIKHIGLNRVTKFDFCKEFRYIGFIMFIGRGFLAGQSYILANNNFLRNSTNIISQKLKASLPVDGHSFRKNPTVKCRLFLDVMKREVTEDDPSFFPYGNINFKGESMPGLKDIPLQTIDTSSIERQFDEALNQHKYKEK
jgi:hypothetical protein